MRSADISSANSQKNRYAHQDKSEAWNTFCNFASSGFYSGLTYTASDIGGYLGNKLYAAMQTQPKAEQKKEQQSEGSLPADTSQAETLLGGLWQGFRQMGQNISNAFSAIWQGAKDAGTAVAGLFKSDEAQGYTGPDLDFVGIMPGGIPLFVPHIGAMPEETKGFDASKISETRELQDDGSYKVTEYNPDGSVKNEHHEYKVKEFKTVHNVASYEDALKFAGKDMSLSSEEITNIANAATVNEYKHSKDLLYYGAQLDVDRQFEEATSKVGSNWQTAAGFNDVVNNLMDQCGNMKFIDQEHLAYTYSAIMEKLTTLYGGTIKYGNQDNLFNKYPGNGYMNNTDHVDCTNLQTIGINILGLSDYKAQDVSLCSKGSYEYDPLRDSAPTKIGNDGKPFIPGTTNYRYNQTLFDEIRSTDVTAFTDLRGTIGTMQLPSSEGGYWDHVYASLRTDASRIVDSYGGYGISTPRPRSNDYKNRTVAYLKLRLPEYRRTSK